MVRVTCLSLGALAVGCLLGCATVMEPGPGALGDPGEQQAIAELLDAALQRLPRQLAGQDVHVAASPTGTSFHAYAQMRLESAVLAAGGHPAAGATSALFLDLRVAGRDRAERNLMLPLGQYARLPLYYGQDDLGDLGATLRYVGADGLQTWDISRVRRDRTSYFFRVIGPF